MSQTALFVVPDQLKKRDRRPAAGGGYGRERCWFLGLALAGGLTLTAAVPAFAVRADDSGDPVKGQALQAAGQAAAGHAALRTRTPAADQQAAAQSAETDGLHVRWHSQLGTPVSVRGRDLTQRGAYSGGKGLKSQGGGAFERDAVAVLDNVSRLYGMRDAAQEFTSHRTDADALGFHHARLRQQFQGLPVVGGDLIVHFNRRGEAYEVNGTYVADITVPAAPALTGAEAVQRAAADLAGLNLPAAAVTEGPALCIFAFEVAPALAYEITLSYGDAKAGPGRWRYWVDAATGAVLLRYNDIQRIAAPTTNGTLATVTGSILSGEGGGATNVTGWHENTGYTYLYDTNLRWYVYNVAISGYADTNTYAFRATNDWAQTDRAEMSLARNFTLTQRYYRDVHGLNSFDGLGIQARANAHVGTDYANAYWDGTAFYFGDGDGTVAGPMGVLDVCGHEYTHAVTEHTAGLIYSGESGALNESFSDIMGTCVEAAYQPDGRSLYPAKSPAAADWLIGEDAWLSAPALRDMRSPGNAATVGANGRQPSRYKGAYWIWSQVGLEVHQNDGVQNFFFYLLSDGGSGNNDGIDYAVTGIGITNAAQVAYRALTVYCLPYTSYREARDAWISAAEDLNPAWAPSVRAAWNAVDVPVLVISPTNALVFRGPLGGPFGLVSPSLTLVNYDGAAIAWSTTHTQAWLTAAAAGVAPGGRFYMNIVRTTGPDIQRVAPGERWGTESWVSHTSVHEAIRLAEMTLAK